MGFLDIFKSKPVPTCPSCNQPIDILPKRSGTCIHCKQKYYMCKDPEDGKYIFTNTQGKEAIEIKKQHLIDLGNSSNNTASFEGAKESGVALSKEWLTSGLPDVKEMHKYYESLGPVEMDYEYAPGLKYPGDPHCKDPKELDGCRCTIVFNVE